MYYLTPTYQYLRHTTITIGVRGDRSSRISSHTTMMCCSMGMVSLQCSPNVRMDIQMHASYSRGVENVPHRYYNPHIHKGCMMLEQYNRTCQGMRVTARIPKSWRFCSSAEAFSQSQVPKVQVNNSAFERRALIVNSFFQTHTYLYLA